jgi:DNA repair exonuclease SbcCD ATPase subunit
MTMADPVDELFRLPRPEFIPARDRLAARFAAANERERAREVRALRRPTVAAWVVNQLAHRNRTALRRLLDAGQVLRRAHARVLRGGSADDLRAAARRRQDALRELQRLAGPLLREGGSAAHPDGVLATLEAASVDPEAAKAVTAGRLSRELPRPSGFGDTASPAALVTGGRTRPAAERGERARSAQPAQRPRLRALVAEAKRLARVAAQSARDAARATRRRAALERKRRTHEKRVEELREALQAAERRLRDAEAELARARAEEARASERARQRRRSAEAARAGGGDRPPVA